MIQNVSLKKYLLTCAVGFGLGGLLWGLDAFFGTVGAGEVFTNPFSYILGIAALGLLGSFSLILFSKNKRQILKVSLSGLFGCLAGFVGVALFSYYLYLYGGLILANIFGRFLDIEIINKFINLSPSLGVGDLWLVFFLSGGILGLFYSLILKTKIWPIIWRGGTGFVLGSFVGPVIGNLVGNALNSLLASYLIAFAIISISLGLFLGWGIYKNYKQ